MAGRARNSGGRRVSQAGERPIIRAWSTPIRLPSCRRLVVRRSAVPTSHLRVWPGAPYPLGATWDGVGVNFALFSEHATRVELCLFDSVDAEVESLTIPLPEQTDMVWHGYLPDVHPGSFTATACMARSRRTPGIASIRTSSCWIRTPRSSAGRCAGTSRCSDSRPGATTPRSTIATARRTRRSPPSSIRRSRGVTIGRCAFRGTTR